MGSETYWSFVYPYLGDYACYLYNGPLDRYEDARLDILYTAGSCSNSIDATRVARNVEYNMCCKYQSGGAHFCQKNCNGNTARPITTTEWVHHTMTFLVFELIMLTREFSDFRLTPLPPARMEYTEE